MGFSNRDFIDKLIYFKHNNAYYIYITQAPDELLPPKKDIVRAISIAGMYKIEMNAQGTGVYYKAAL